MRSVLLIDIDLEELLETQWILVCDVYEQQHKKSAVSESVC